MASQDDMKRSGRSSRVDGEMRLGCLGLVLQGKWLSWETYKHNMAGIVIVVGLFVVYITFKFDVQMKITEIDRLNNDLANARTEMVTLSAKYRSQIRESEMIEQLDTLHLNLRTAEQPPYYLDKPADDGKKAK